MKVDLNQYKTFVSGVVSPTSVNLDLFVTRLRELESLGINASALNTAGTGLSGEVGEFNEIIKKLFWHGKPFTDEIRTHLLKECGDIIWYWTLACIALGVDPNEIVATNVEKLQARYPGGKFDVYNSENRQAGDI